MHAEGSQPKIDIEEGLDPELLSNYGMFLLGYIDGCWARKDLP
jgi:hypothetical protein